MEQQQRIKKRFNKHHNSFGKFCNFEKPLRHNLNNEAL